MSLSVDVLLLVDIYMSNDIYTLKNIGGLNTSAVNLTPMRCLYNSHCVDINTNGENYIDIAWVLNPHYVDVNINTNMMWISNP